MLSSLPSQVDGEVAGIQVPDQVQKQWHSNPVHGTEFRAWMETFNEEFPEPDQKGAKQNASAAAGTTNTPNKVQKVGAKPIDMSMFGPLLREKGKEPGETVLQRVSLLYLSNIDLVIQTGAIFVTNATVPPKKHQILPQVLCQPGYEYIRK
jgi:hypothetical protein